MSEQFVKLSHAVIDHADLDAHELLVYIVLLRYRNPKTGQCFPGLQTIADAARMSRKTASRTVAKLEDRGLIKVERVKAVGSKTNESNTYTVGLLPEDPMKYLGRSAKGQRVPKRVLSRDSESLPSAEDAPSRDSESLRRDSESLGVGTPSLTKKINLKKINEEDVTHAFGESTFENVSFDSSDEDPATEKQVEYLRDLAIHQGYEAGYGVMPDDLALARWRKLTRREAHDLIRAYLKNLGRPDEIYYPEYGTPQYEALSPAGKEFADSAGMPDSVWGYSSAARFMKENSA